MVSPSAEAPTTAPALPNALPIAAPKTSPAPLAIAAAARADAVDNS